MDLHKKDYPLLYRLTLRVPNKLIVFVHHNLWNHITQRITADTPIITFLQKTFDLGSFALCSDKFGFNNSLTVSIEDGWYVLTCAFTNARKRQSLTASIIHTLTVFFLATETYTTLSPTAEDEHQLLSITSLGKYHDRRIGRYDLFVTLSPLLCMFLKQQTETKSFEETIAEPIQKKMIALYRSMAGQRPSPSQIGCLFQQEKKRIMFYMPGNNCKLITNTDSDHYPGMRLYSNNMDAAVDIATCLIALATLWDIYKLHTNT